MRIWIEVSTAVVTTECNGKWEISLNSFSLKYCMKFEKVSYIWPQAWWFHFMSLLQCTSCKRCKCASYSLVHTIKNEVWMISTHFTFCHIILLVLIMNLYKYFVRTIKTQLKRFMICLHFIQKCILNSRKNWRENQN